MHTSRKSNLRPQTTISQEVPDGFLSIGAEEMVTGTMPSLVESRDNGIMLLPFLQKVLVIFLDEPFIRSATHLQGKG